MTLTELKKSIHEKIDSTNDQALLEMVNDIVNQPREVFQIPKEHLAGIEQGIQDIKNGNYITLEEFEKRYEKWLKD